MSKTLAKNSLAKSKVPAWFSSYQKKNTKIAVQEVFVNTKIFNITPFIELIKKKSTQAPKITVNGAKVISFSQAAKDKKIAAQIKSAVASEAPPSDQFAAFANANVTDPSVILVENDVDISVVLSKNSVHKQIILVNTENEVNLFVEVNGDDSFFNSTIVCPKNSKVNLLVVPKMSGIINMHSIVGENGFVRASNAWLFGEKTRAYYTNALNGKNARFLQSDAVFLEKNQEVHVAMRAIHAGKESMSHTRMRCVLFDNAKQSFDGLIKILPGAQLTQSYLEANSMLLSDNAKSTNIPKLEIETDDVKATHAATVEHLDEEKRFYLESRGLSRSETERIIIASFLEGIFLDFSDDIKSKIKELVGEKLVARYNVVAQGAIGF